MSDFKNIKPGQFFTIGETLSYPKYKTSDGYVDVRDLLHLKRESLNFPVRLMSDEEVSKSLETPIEEVREYMSQQLKIKNII